MKSSRHFLRFYIIIFLFTSIVNYSPFLNAETVTSGDLTVDLQLKDGKLLIQGKINGVDFFGNRSIEFIISSGQADGRSKLERGSAVFEKLEQKEACVTVTGNVKLGESSSPVSLTISPAEGGLLKMEMSFVPNMDVLTEAGVIIPVKLSDDPKQRRATLPDTDYQRYEHWLLKDPYTGYPEWMHGGVLQIRPNSYRIWKSSEVDTYPLVTVAGKNYSGWIDLSDDNQGVTIGVRDFASLPRADIYANNRDGKLGFFVQSSRMNPLDLRKSSIQIPGARTAAEIVGIEKGKPKTACIFMRCHIHDLTKAKGPNNVNNAVGRKRMYAAGKEAEKIKSILK